MADPLVLVRRGNSMPSEQHDHSNNDNIIIRKFGAGVQPGLSYTNGEMPSVLPLEEGSQAPKSKPKKSSVKKTQMSIPFEAEQKPDYTRQWKLIAVFSMLFAFLLGIALLTYSQSDAANAELNMRDVSGIVRGDDEMRARADTTQNWLGLFGAVISNFLFNHTYGIGTLMLPALIVWWAKHLFVTQSIPRLVMKRTAMAVSLGVLGAGIFGVMQLTVWLPTLSPEWSGAIGQFIASVLSDFIGKIGAFLLLTVGFVCVLYIGADLDIDKGLSTLSKVGEYLKTVFARGQQEDFPKNDVEEIKQDTKDYSVEKQVFQNTSPKVDDEEPANIMRRAARNSNGTEKNTQQPAPKSTPVPDPVIKKPQEQLSIPHDKVINNDDIVPYERNASLKPMTNHTDLPPQRYPTPPLKPVKNDIVPQEHIIPEEAKKEDKYVSRETGEILEAKIQEEPNRGDSEVEEKNVQANEDVTETERESGKPALIVTVQDKPVVNIEEVLEPIIDDYDKELDYIPPGMDLLIEPPKQNTEIDEAELAMNARLLQEKLGTFKITIENLEVTPGPVVTQYEFVPAAGIKISQIESLADDMALALKARGIRIIAPIPGKGTVGIEIPNHNPTTIYFRSIINNSKFYDSEHRLPLALGKTISGEVYIADLAKMPHLLIAGATGAGKSVGVNTMIASLLYKMHPKNLKLVFIDPKKVEMSFYSALEKHFLAICPDVDERIITNPANAVIMLKSLVAEMERRYDILASVGQRNIVDYNKKVEEGKYKDSTKFVHKQMPYIVVVIDELADLMMTAAKEVEEPIARLAQLARAIGIHLIVATQRPSVNVITGYIKANFPARVAYQVASKIDSRTILDMNGADQLLGNGDMLFLPGGSPKPIRLQNSFLSTDEVEAICSFIGQQDGYDQPFMLPSVVEKNAENDGPGFDFSGGRDALFADAAAIVVTHQQGSVSLLQRRLKVGYARAARIMDELEAAGVVGPFDGSKARAVMIESLADLEAYL